MGETGTKCENGPPYGSQAAGRMRKASVNLSLEKLPDCSQKATNHIKLVRKYARSLTKLLKCQNILSSSKVIPMSGPYNIKCQFQMMRRHQLLKIWKFIQYHRQYF